MRETINITAHAGCEGTIDDSLESVETGIRSGADIIEVDARLNRQGILVFSHDEDPEGEYQGKPLLEEALDLIARSPGTGVNCDVKEPEIIPIALDLAARKGLGRGRFIFTGAVSPSLIAEIPGILDKSSVWLNIEEILGYLFQTGHEAVKSCRDLMLEHAEAEEIIALLTPWFDPLLEALVESCLGWGVRVVNMPCTEITVYAVPRLRERGIGASLWTVNDEETLTRLLRLGVTGITTRKPRLAVELRKAL
jgi:glycerophosphoryl diester phosphodiesterase